MLSGFLAGALGVLGGAKRWLTKETAGAVIATVAVIGLLVGGVLLFGAGKSSGGVRERLACLSGIAKANAIAHQTATLRNAASVQAAETARDNAIGALKAEAERSAALERQLSTYIDNPVAYPRDLVRSLHK